MHRVFQTFTERLAESVDTEAIRTAMMEATTALDLPTFAYLTVPCQPDAEPSLISTYPSGWTNHYLQNRYERIDAVITRARRGRILSHGVRASDP